VVIFWVVIVAINFFGVRGYGEAEFVFSIIKVVAVIGFILLGIIIAAGGVPGSPQGYLGAHYWYDPVPSTTALRAFAQSLSLPPSPSAELNWLA
jgi:amino acid permease